MKSLEDIAGLYQQRRKALGPIHARMIEVRDTYNGDVVVPLPELEANEKVAVANLVQLALDQTGMRIASTAPAMDFPPLRRGIKTSEDKARTRRLAVTGWHERNRLGLQRRRRARWLLGYATAPTSVRPTGWDAWQTDNEGIPVWQLRDPLQTYPAPTLNPDEILPPDCIVAFKRSKEWLRAKYPDEFMRLRKHDATSTFEIIEYADDEEIVMCVIGHDNQENWAGQIHGSSPFEQLERTPNRAGMPITVCPGRITLDRAQGQFDGALGIYQAKARLFALMQLATERSIFPEEWVVSAEGRNAQVTVEPDAKTGVMGRIQGGTLQVVQPQPGVFSSNVLDREEYEMRQTGAIPAEWGGSGSQNVRTGRRGAQVMEAAVDFFIQEAQEVLEESTKVENVIAINTAKGYHGTKQVSFYVNGLKVEYTPNEHFETTDHRVRYAYTGADQNSLNIIVGQKIGMKTLSKKAAMEIDSMVADVDAMQDEITVEGLREAFLSSIQTQAADPAGPYQPGDFARLIQLIRTDKLELEDAVAKLQEEVQAKQAEAVPEQPGLGVPGAPGTPPAIAPPEPSVANLASTLGKLRLGQMQGTAERQQEVGRP